jgi:hypothetical protein
MPSGRTHAAITRRILGSTDGRLVQQLMDRTAKAHGPSHRRDHEHSLEGVAVELMKRGQLTPQNMTAAVLHQLTDRAFDEMGRALPAGTPRRIGKLLMEDAIVNALRGSR